MAGIYSKLCSMFSGKNKRPAGVIGSEQLVAKIIIPASASASYEPVGGTRIAISAVGPKASEIVRRSVATGEIIDSVLTSPVELVKESTEFFCSARQFAPEGAATGTVSPMPPRQTIARQIPLPRTGTC